MQQRPDHTSIDETRVSVVIPYSPEHTPAEMLEEARQSVKSQSVPTEIIVVEDTEQHGPAWARNKGIKQASTRFISFLDADDLWEDDKLRAQIQCLKKNQTGICVQGEYDDTKAFMRDLFVTKASSLTSSILIDTSQVDILFEEKLERREDHLFMLEAMAKSGGCFLPNLVKIRKHEEGLSSRNTPELRIKQNEFFVELVAEKVDKTIVEQCEDELFRRLYYRIGRTEHQKGRYQSAIDHFRSSLAYDLSVRTIGAMVLSIKKYIISSV